MTATTADKPRSRIRKPHRLVLPVLVVGLSLAFAAAAAANVGSLFHLRTAFRRVTRAAASGPLWPSRVPTQFRTIDVSGAAWTATNAVNNMGTVVGVWVKKRGEMYGFGYIEQPGGQPTTFNYPGTSNETLVSGLNDVGVAVGGYFDSGTGVFHGWVRSPDGSFTQLDDPLGASGTVLSQINDRGLIVGGYTDASGGQHGFVYDRGAFTTLDYPGAAATALTSVNNSGAIVGFYTDASGVDHGFLYRHRTFTAIDAPGAGTAPGQGTIPVGISSSGTIDGTVLKDSGGGFFGWLFRDGQFSSLNEPDAPLGMSTPLGLSSNGRLASGEYFDASGVLHGYVATLSPWSKRGGHR